MLSCQLIIDGILLLLPGLQVVRVAPERILTLKNPIDPLHEAHWYNSLAGAIVSAAGLTPIEPRSETFHTGELKSSVQEMFTGGAPFFVATFCNLMVHVACRENPAELPSLVDKNIQTIQRMDETLRGQMLQIAEFVTIDALPRHPKMHSNNLMLNLMNVARHADAVVPK